MPDTSILIALFTLAASPQEKSADAALRQEAMRLGLAYVASEEQAPDPSAIMLYRNTQDVSMRDRCKRILAEIEALGEHDWAGRYYCGDRLGMNVVLTIAPEAGATYTWSGCMGLYDLNHGDIEQVSGRRIQLDLAIDPSLNERRYECSRPTRYMSDEWIVVRWADDRFLVPTSQMIAFCNDVTSRAWSIGYPRRTIEGKTARWDLRPDGLPDVPDAYRPFLLDKRRDGAILWTEGPVTIGKFRDGKTDMELVRARVDIGATDGLLPGMRLYVTETDEMGVGQVVSVEEGGAIVEFRSGGREPTQPVGPLPGWSVSTRAPMR